MSGASDPKLLVRTLVDAQQWIRDEQASFGTNLTNAVEFTLGR